MSVLTKSKALGDVVKHEYHEAFTRESGTFRNTSGGSITLTGPIGTPVKKSAGKWVPVLAGDEANVGGLLLRQEAMDALANNTDYPEKVAVLVRGPAIIYKDALPDDDVAGDALNKTTLQTALLTKNILCYTAPSNTETQTT